MVQSRLRHRLRALGLSDFPQYCEFLHSEQGEDERRKLISALTTNVSHFFRENHHFEKLRDLLKTRVTTASAGRPIRIWSAGCSNGQESLSTAMTVLEDWPDAAALDLRILATDIDPVVVQFARQGHYPDRLAGGMSDEQKARYFDVNQPDSGEPTYTAKRTIRNLIRYNELNLLGPWPMKNRFDVIFCRNVVIYFDAVTQEKLWPRFRQALGPDGLLFLGHSERIADPERFGFECIGPTTYRPISS